MTAPDVLAVLDFTAAPLCGMGEGCPETATHYVVTTCGHAEPACDHHAQHFGWLDYAAELGRITLGCSHCTTPDIRLARLERIAV